jgi:hypothetical protein
MVLNLLYGQYLVNLMMLLGDDFDDEVIEDNYVVKVVDFDERNQMYYYYVENSIV